MNDTDDLREVARQVPWVKIAIFWLGLVIFVGLLTYLARDQISFLGENLWHRYGLLGLFAIVILIDTYTPGFPFETFVFLALAGGGTWWILALVSGSASSLAGALGYAHGRLLDRQLRVHDRFRDRPWLAQLKRFGALYVAVGALTPLPYSAINWSAGALRLPIRACFAATWIRLARTLVFTYLMHIGWKIL